MESIKNGKKELEFTCPQCGGHDIFEHLVNYEKVWIYDDGEMEFGDTEWWEDDKVEYSCAELECFWTIVDEDNDSIIDQESLIRWLQKMPKPKNTVFSETASQFIDPDCFSRDGDTGDDGHIRFKCPKCGGKQLAAVNHTATYLTIYDDGTVEYPKTYGGDIEYFRCNACRWIVEDDEQGRINDPEILVSWLNANCSQASV